MSQQSPNIILVTIDALRADHLGCYGYSRCTSPNIDRLAAKGVLFQEAISNGGDTPSSFPSMLASQPPPIAEYEYLLSARQKLTLAELLNRSGYRTAAYHCNPYVTRFFHYDRGFEVFEDTLHALKRVRKTKTGKRKLQVVGRPQTFFAKVLTKIGYLRNHFLYSLGMPSGIPAEKLTSQAISWLDKCPSSFFLWLHYMDTHFPYLPPSNYAREFCKHHVNRYKMSALYLKQLENFASSERLSSTQLENLINLYDASISYIDDNLGRLFESLGGRSENTIIVVTADHGEVFGEHGSLGHGLLYEELVRVPLVIAGGGLRAGTIVKEAVELMDLAPTIADLTGVGSADSFHGQSLLPVITRGRGKTKGIISAAISPPLAKRSLAYRTPEWKYIRGEGLYQANALLSEEIYNLINDPRESNNLHGSRDKEARAFQVEAIDRLQRFKQHKRAYKTESEKGRIRAKLKEISE